MVIANYYFEIGVIRGGFGVLIAYLLDRRRVIWAVEEVGLLEIKGQKVGELFGVIARSLLISL